MLKHNNILDSIQTFPTNLKFNSLALKGAFFIVFSFLVFLFLFLNFKPELEPQIEGVNTTREGKYIYESEYISARDGGIFENDDIKVIFPAGFTDKDIRLEYRTVSDRLLNAENRISAMYELNAFTEDNKQVTEFDKHLTIQTTISEGLSINSDFGGTYFYDETSSKWERLESTTFAEENQIVAITDHFTTFTTASDNPNGSQSTIFASNVGTNAGALVDDSDPEPNFVWRGTGDSTQPAYRDYILSGINGSASITGNSIDTTPRNSGTWNAIGLSGELPVSVTIPVVNYCTPKGTCSPLTSAATYLVTHANGTDSITIDQFSNQGQTVLLGNFTFNGTGSVKLTDVVAEQGKVFKSFVVFDAVIFGDIGVNLDITPPVISDVKAMTSNGTFCIQASVTDDESGVGEVVLFLNRGGNITEYVMNAQGDTYSVCVPGIRQGENLSYEIGAIDLAGNEGYWNMKRGYVSRGSFGRHLGYHPGMIYSIPSVTYDKKVCFDCATGHYVADPVNTINGNLIDEQKLVQVNSLPDIELNITYNSQGGRTGIFGENWTHSYNYHLIDMESADYTGAFVQYPSGFIAEFAGSNYDPDPGVYEKLSKIGENYELTFKDLSKVIFDNVGDIKEYQDPNGNKINFEYGEKYDYTMMSQITKISTDNGRTVELTYGENGLVNEITAPEGINLRFEYSDSDDLAIITDARGYETKFEYIDHNLTKKISPKGHDYYTNEYDDERRVVYQNAGNDFESTFKYSDSETIKLDSYSNEIRYKFNDENLLQELIDQNGKSKFYKYDNEKNLSEFTDNEGNITKYEYDDNGNRIAEIDALGSRIETQFNQNFNKPTSEIYKLADHISNFEYDSQGKLLKFINAKGDSSYYNYNSKGQVEEYKDFNGNSTNYEYDSNGDLVQITYPEGNTDKYEYDNLGRVIKFINGRNFEYAYIYDEHDNLLELSGPIGFSNTFKYDPNNHLVEVTDANGGISKYIYDEAENLVKSINQLGFETSKITGSMNELLQKIDPEGRISEYSYDKSFNTLSETLAKSTTDESTTQFLPDGNRNTIETVDGEGRVSVLKYDPLQRLIEEVRNATENPADSENNVSSKFEYSPTGMLVRVTDPNGNETNYIYDELDQLVEKKDAEGSITRYSYDANGNLVKVTNPRGFETVYTYDKNNRLIKETDALSGEYKFSYDENDNLIFKIDDNGVVTKFEYDALDRNILKVENYKDADASADTNVTTKYDYDLNENVIKITNPRGYETNFTYDAANRNTKITDAYGNSTKITYDMVNNITKLTDRNGNSENFQYDNQDRIIKYTNAEGHTQKFSYDKVGNELSFTNERGKVFSKIYDALNRVSTNSNPLGDSTSSTYDAAGNLLTFTDENGHTDKFSYDKIYRTIELSDAEGYTTKFEYDPNSNKIKTIDGNDNFTQYKYDELDRLVEIVNAEEEVEKFSYDRLENMTLETMADGTLNKFEYDPIYRLAQVINNYKDGESSNNDTNVITKYLYDANGNNIAQINPLGNTTRFEFDKLDRIVREINPLENTWQYGYDPVGNLVSRTDANGVKTRYSYLPDDELQKISYPDHDVTYKYSQTNYPLEMSDKLGSTAWSYDAIDRMISQNDPFDKVLGYQYDGVGNLTKLTYPDRRSISHSYLKNDWLQKSITSDSDSTTYKRDGVGNPVLTTRSNNTYSSVIYDRVYRQLEVEDRQDSNVSALITKFDYTYNEVGDITKEIANYGWRQPSEVITNYEYDGLHRLAYATSDDQEDSTYEYDAAGNRLRLIEELKQGTEVKTYNYNGANQLLNIEIDSPMNPNIVSYAYKYDNNGNRIDELIKDSTGVDRGTQYSYTYENKLSIYQEYQGEIVKNNKTKLDEYQINYLDKTTLEYDGNSRRLAKTYMPGNSSANTNDTFGRVEYTFDRLDPVVKYDLQNGQRQNIYRDPYQNILYSQDFKSEQAPNGTISFFHYDGEGNMSATSKHLGQSDHSYRLDEYGMPLPTTGGDKNQNNGGSWVAPHNEFVLSQKEFDSNMDLYYFGSRHYDPQTGTWIEQDSYRGELQNPKSLHRYMYNYNSPVNYVDWYGYQSIPLTASYHTDYYTDSYLIDLYLMQNETPEEYGQRHLEYEKAKSAILVGGVAVQATVVGGILVGPAAIAGATSFTTATSSTISTMGLNCLVRLGPEGCQKVIDTGMGFLGNTLEKILSPNVESPIFDPSSVPSPEEVGGILISEFLWSFKSEKLNYCPNINSSTGNYYSKMEIDQMYRIDHENGGIKYIDHFTTF